MLFFCFSGQLMVTFSVAFNEISSKLQCSSWLQPLLTQVGDEPTPGPVALEGVVFVGHNSSQNLYDTVANCLPIFDAAPVWANPFLDHWFEPATLGQWEVADSTGAVLRWVPWSHIPLAVAVVAFNGLSESKEDIVVHLEQWSALSGVPVVYTAGSLDALGATPSSSWQIVHFPVVGNPLKRRLAPIRPALAVGDFPWQGARWISWAVARTTPVPLKNPIVRDLADECLARLVWRKDAVGAVDKVLSAWFLPHPATLNQWILLRPRPGADASAWFPGRAQTRITSSGSFQLVCHVQGLVRAPRVSNHPLIQFGWHTLAQGDSSCSSLSLLLESRWSTQLNQELARLQTTLCRLREEG